MKRAMIPTREASKLTAQDVGRAIGHLTGDVQEWSLIFQRSGYKLLSTQWTTAMEAAREEHERQIRKEEEREIVSRAHREQN